LQAQETVNRRVVRKGTLALKLPGIEVHLSDVFAGAAD
jgi:hypothetical protein